MKTNFYLVVNSKGAVGVKKSKPAVRSDEVCIACGLILPDTLFQKPQINATITIDPTKVMPLIINAETEQLVKGAIESATGLEVKLTIDNQVLTQSNE